MEEITNIAIYFRGAERILIVICGLVCILLGYLLFKHNITHEQSAEWESTPFSLKLSKVSPGTFFAILGAAVLCWSIFTTTEITTERTEGGNKPETDNYPSEASDASIKSRDKFTMKMHGVAEQNKLLKVYNTIIDVLDPSLLGSLTGTETSAFNSARLALVQERLVILNGKFSPKVMNRYLKYVDSIEPAPLDFASTYDEINLLMTTSLVDN